MKKDLILVLLISFGVAAMGKQDTIPYQKSSHIRLKRWVDVDDDDSHTKSGIREKTPSADDLASLLGSTEKSLSDQLKSATDISNLESAAPSTAAVNQESTYQNQPAVEAGSLLSEGIAINAGTGETMTLGSPEPFQEESALSRELDSVPGDVTLPGSSSLASGAVGSTEKEGPQPSFIEQLQRPAAPPLSDVSDFTGLHFRQQTRPTQNLDRETSIFPHTTDATGHVQVAERETSIFPQVTEVNSASPIHHFEGPMNKYIGPEHKYVPGKSFFYKPLRFLHRSQPLFRHIHAFNRPRIIVIRRRPPPHRFVLTEPSLRIQSQIASQMCQDATCKNGGSCYVVNDLIKCICSKGFRGSRCETQSLCHPDPCKNGGTCTETDRGFTCTCTISFIGEKCDVQSYCHPNPCRNSGQCYEKGNGFECSCATGFKGSTCTFPSLCHPNPCQNDGVCSEDDQSFRCTCHRGFSGSSCEGRRLTCNANTCQNGGSCTEDGSTVTCSCVEEFRGKYCEERVYRACQTNTCLFGGTCIEVNTYEFRCACPVGRTGKRCAAVVEDPCAHCSRHALCNDDGCVCKPGYTGSGFYCEREKSNCHPNPCENGGTCIDRFYYLDVIANSPSGAVRTSNTENSGAFALSPYRHPSSQSDAVSPNAVATNDLSQEPRGFHLRMFKREVSQQEVEVIPRRSAFDDLLQVDKPANKYRREANKERRMTSAIQDGDLLARKRRYDGLPGSISKNDLEFYGFACECRLRFKGLKCEIPDPCNPNPCFNGGTCVDIDGMQHCKCAPPFVGQFCNMDRCDRCDPNAHCLSDSGLCRCNPGYYGDGYFCALTHEFRVSQAPTSERNPCASNPCVNGGTCIPQPSATRNFICICIPGFAGPVCTEKVDNVGGSTSLSPHANSPPGSGNPPPRIPANRYGSDQAGPPSMGTQNGRDDDEERPTAFCHPNPCLNDGKCIKTTEGYTCICGSQFTGRHCEEDKCMECDIHAICIMGLCKCRHGYKGDGFSCEKVKKCPDCQDFAICLEGMCICQPGYYSQGNQCQAVPLPQMAPPTHSHIAPPPPPPPPPQPPPPPAPQPPPPPPPPPPLPPPPRPVYYPQSQYMTPALPPPPRPYSEAHSVCYDPCYLMERACVCPHAPSPPQAPPALAVSPYSRSPQSLVQQRVKGKYSLDDLVSQILDRISSQKKSLETAKKRHEMTMSNNSSLFL